MACFETLNLSLPAEDVRLLERLAEKKQTTMAAVVREALYMLSNPIGIVGTILAEEGTPCKPIVRQGRKVG